MQAAIAACTFVLLWATAGHCQPDTLWSKSHRHAASNECTIIRTADGGYALGGQGNSERVEVDGGDFMLVKFDSLANLEWRQFYTVRQPTTDQGFTAAQLRDGGYVVSGRSSGDCVIVRTDADGDSLWMVIYEEEVFDPPANGETECIGAPDGNIVIVTQEVTAKISEEDGDIIWRIELEGTVTSVLAMGDEGFFVAGYTGRWEDIYIALIDAEGELVWQQVYGTDDADLSVNAIAASGGGYCIAGVSRDGGGGLGIHPIILRVDEDGELIWMHNYSDFRGDNLRDIIETPDGGFAACGFGSWGRFYYLMRMDYAGEVHWTTYFADGQPNHIPGEAYNVFLMEDGGYLLGGFSNHVGAWFVRTEPDPVDLPFELEIEVDEHDFEEVAVDSVVAWEFEMRNTGRRYVVIDSLWFEGDTAAFACPLDLPFRIDPEDTSFVPVLFQPLADTTYTATLILPFGDEQTLEITLSGRGFLQSAPEEPNVLREFVLHAAYPNPFNSSTHIRYSLDRDGFVTLKLYDLKGREVACLTNEKQSAGNHQTVWDAEGEPSGMYLLRLNVDGRKRVTKLILIR